MEYRSYYDSPIGKIVLVSNGQELTGLWFESSRFIETYDKREYVLEELPIFLLTKYWLDRYFKGENPDFREIPIHLEGTDFSLKVLRILSSIPYGEVITYGEIAKMIDAKMSSQAVGRAVGHNPISIIIPCHRVVGAKGDLVGYSGGLDKKIALLKIEGVDVDCMHRLKNSGDL